MQKPQGVQASDLILGRRAAGSVCLSNGVNLQAGQGGE